MGRTALLLVLLACLAAACGTTRTADGRSEVTVDPSQLAKTDIDRVAEAHRHEVFASLRLLAEKLYKRNPREWKKAGHASLDEALARLFDPAIAWQLPQLEGKSGSEAVLLALREDYKGDRVAAYIAGLGGMLHVSFNGKTEFFMIDDLDPQRLHNAARNLEIAAWKLAHSRDATGAPLLLSNEMTPVQNLTFEREFGKMIGGLDVLSKIIADKTNRTVVKVIQSLATAVFLPLPSLPGFK
jgi:hypothetical protein